MKPAAFAYRAPTTLEEALAELAEHGPDARVLSGGQSLVRLMNSRIDSPRVVVDINRLPGLDEILVDGSLLRIGALVRQRTCETSPDVRRLVPVLAEAGAEVAHVSIRERGTVVGSISFADPCAELPTALLALDGEVVARSAAGERTIAAKDFFQGPYRTALRPDEMLVEARVGAPSSGRVGSAFLEVTRRHGELPVCGVATILRVDDADQVVEARISIGAVADRPRRAARAEEFLRGAGHDPQSWQRAGQIAADEIEPVGTLHGSADFRRHLVAVLTRRSLVLAGERAHQNGDPR